MSQTPQSKGGEARAARLSPEQRRSIAQQAAAVRWAVPSDAVPTAEHIGILRIGDAEIPCAVLDDGRRLITQLGFLRAIGRGRPQGGTSQGSTGEGLPAFLSSDNLKPFISNELRRASEPIIFRPKKGGGKGGNRAFGYAAELLPQVARVYLDARRENALQAQQRHVAEACEILLMGLAEVGIVALVDEATGYQDIRDRDELHRLLAVYLSAERLRWAKRFPDEFYRQIYRLKKWPWPNDGRRTPYVGKITNELVYDKLPQGVLDELRTRNPSLEGTGRRRWKHHQFLSEDIGQPDLRDHLLQLVAIMRASRSWDEFDQNFQRAFPGSQGKLDLQPLSPHEWNDIRA